MDKEHILSEIKRTTEENSGKPLGRLRFEQATGIRHRDWCGKYWSRWNDALAEAGYAPNPLQSAYTDDFLINKLVELAQEIRRFPTQNDLRVKAHLTPGFPSQSVFGRFGSKQDLAQAALDYCEKNALDNSICKMCIEAVAMVKRDRPDTGKSEERTEYGFVYLMKSGTYYKIGRSNSAERRESEVRLLLPEKLELLHKIKTDDPVGIERYWHERFAAKRMRGEWFDLNRADVSAFKRRKFM